MPGSDAVCIMPSPREVGGCAVAVAVWVEGGAGEAGREGRLRMGRVRSAFIVAG